jgi:glycine hydroxymethyltransferase
MLTASRITALVAEHEAWRSRCMNLIASENALSPAVRRYLSSDFVQRYGNYLGRDLTDRRYAGNRYVQQIEVALDELVREMFGATEVELRAISGHVAGLAVIMATCRPGDTVVELASADGGHCMAEKAARSSLIELQAVPLPFDPLRYNVDAQATCSLIVERQPRLVIIGSSNWLFPAPIREIAACLPKSPRTVLAYDASHVFGLLACGQFQDPLREGAAVVFGSTHKTLPGPQGGLIISNDAGLMGAVATAVYPGIVTNHHLMRAPALALALLEMRAHPGYGCQVVRNAQALARGLTDHGLAVVGADHGYTRSHTVMASVAEHGRGRTIAALLEEADVMISYARLPAPLGTEGIRLGTSEVTRLGAVEADMEIAAEIVAGVVQGKVAPSVARDLVHAWAERLPGIRYSDL